MFSLPLKRKGRSLIIQTNNIPTDTKNQTKTKQNLKISQLSVGFAFCLHVYILVVIKKKLISIIN